MNFHLFRAEFFDTVCFAANQVYAWRPEFDKNNIGRWVKKGLVVRLRNGYYSFPEYLGKTDFAWYIANQIYKPSYISLHTALSFYGLIPESVVQITSVSSLKTNAFTNSFGTYKYKSVQGNLMFGYDVKQLSGGQSLLFAKPEKALVDLLYLYPFYQSQADFEGLRLDEDILSEQADADLLMEYAVRMGSKALELRVRTLIKTYGL